MTSVLPKQTIPPKFGAITNDNAVVVKTVNTETTSEVGDLTSGLKGSSSENEFHGTTRSSPDIPSNAAWGPAVAGSFRGPLQARMGQIEGKGADVDRAMLTHLATQAVAQAVAAGDSSHPALKAFGDVVGTVLGVIVTEALALLPSWNTPVLDASGKPVASVEGAERIGEHDILKRHQEVVGPKVLAYVQNLNPGHIRELLTGVGEGAAAAPGLSYRLEAKITDALT